MVVCLVDYWVHDWAAWWVVGKVGQWASQMAAALVARRARELVVG